MKTKKYIKDMPHLVKEYDFEKNQGINFSKITYGSDKRVWWICQKGHSWDAHVKSRSRGHGCPYCSGRIACKDNCIKFTNPNILNIWNYNKNTLKPTEVTAGSHKKVWWKCFKGHEWKAVVSGIVRGNTCPYCSGAKVCKNNSLAIKNPKLAKEWSSRNKLKPNEVTTGSHKIIWWRCVKCRWEWKSNVKNRARGHGCPKCNESKGEKLVSQILDELQVRYKAEYRFPELDNYRYDFVIFEKYKRKPYAAIEYHGKQHYEPVRFGGISKKKAINKLHSCQKRDKIKKQYCLDNNIKYLEIPYTEKDQIEKIIEDFLKA